MDFNKLYEEMIRHKNEEQAQKMSKYMLNKFEYIGIKTPERREIFKIFFKEYKNEEKIDWEFVNKCWENKYREFQYIAADYLKNMKDKLTIDDIPKFKQLILKKSWWDTIDNLDMTIGALGLKDSNVNKILLEWSIDENIWLRRIAIDHQLLRKEKTNTELLEKILKNNLGQAEFFINKAIGWALRDYSKTNPEWVKNFIEKNRENMAKLSIKEASKYL
ncbi:MULTISPECIES: DNA alkylation repair protein [unclassified Leptotrichia]|uniref:DNA alkylation repair protein n=1 Tax=unclassified Leptotrichia TaxID=2633022 RepID=UPI0003ADA659|nr:MULTISPECIES: DNA alkylation repair protein [unclassified Leptotrichia]ERL27376.1 DNA alkylation repair enzyme [Leptotrichia sp. oral taxon 225 str. F0581]WLD73845.1 DNA alkylation repair protein [Leptotrichia sp. HMT-225]